MSVLIRFDALEDPLEGVRAASRGYDGPSRANGFTSQRGKPMKRVSHRLPAVLGGLLVTALVAQLLLGSVLGVRYPGPAVLLAASLLALVILLDAGRGATEACADECYDVSLLVVVALAIGGAVACLYLPLPWGAISPAAVLIVLVGALELSGRS